ncbi:hypothetical protein BO70DRAFT_165038 [Aspergillus heteromorphus CBS 117.55]|uniref:Uncharacterized protein n=1 Tax=Aspergillus heteromorphus CBS 117.55 TaxID=1448321 RepID=A0A317WS68_9EURO|nr:uncharacterized protein BO70DRAFT_165038 [Aspergillus heteromorphus CBS 117.55]PWY89296.1 hypothetical protein BO70DRAFT_165038 [Aspergillus heteromorphus CBS 117.55]
MTELSTKTPWATGVKKVLVSTSTLDNPSVASLRLAYHKHTNQGCISLGINAKSGNSSGQNSLLFRISPESVKTCRLILVSDETLCPEYFVTRLQTRAKNVRDVSLLILELDRALAEETVLCPSNLPSCLPAAHSDLNFAAFARICEFKSLRIYFGRQQFRDCELGILRTFVHGLRTKNLKAVSFDEARQGRIERRWKDLSVWLDKPPDYEESASERVQQVNPPPYHDKSKLARAGEKRPRDHSSLPPEDDGRKRPLLISPESPCCPTEVNTPSPPPPSPAAIRPTDFTRHSSPKRTERDTLARFEHMLCGASDGLIRKLLIRLVCRCLPAISDDLEGHFLSDSEKAIVTKIELIERHLERVIEAKIKSILETHILKEIVQETVDSALSKCCDRVLDECEVHKTEFSEHVDDSKTDVCITADDCMKEMEEQAQKHMDEIEEQAQQYMHKIEDQGTEAEMSAEKPGPNLKRWLGTSAQSLPASKSRPSQGGLSIKGRRSSF